MNSVNSKAAAQQLCDLGFNVVPMWPHSRASRVRWTKRRNQPCTTSVVDADWHHYPQAEPGVVLDAATRHVMIDIDDMTKIEDLRARGLPATLGVVARRGVHYIYRWPESEPYPKSCEIMKGVELKANCLTAMPPSTHAKDPSFRYAYENGDASVSPAPVWLVQFVKQEQGNGRDCEPWLEEMNSQFAVLRQPPGAILREYKDADAQAHMALTTPEKLKILYRNAPVVTRGSDGKLKRRDRTESWLCHLLRREYEGITLTPGPHDQRFYNLWRGWAIEARQGKCSLFWRHIKAIICAGDKERYEYLRKFMAHAIQRPTERPMVAAVLRGPQGAGKGIFIETWGMLYGQHYMAVHSTEDVLARFNSQLAPALLLYLDEAVWGGNKKHEGQLKALITEPRIWIEEKMQPRYAIPNYRRIVVASNERWAVPVGPRDRRYIVFDVADTYAENPTATEAEKRARQAYFDALIAERENGGLPALMWDLQHEDLTGFVPTMRLPNTGTFDMMLQSAEPHVRFWYQLLNDRYVANDRDGVSWPEDGDGEIDKAKVYKTYVYFCKSLHLHPQQDAQFWNAVKNELHVVDPTDRRHGTRFARVHQLAVARSNFLVYMGVGGDIWDEQSSEELKPESLF